MTHAAPTIDKPATDTGLDEAFRNITGLQEQVDDGSEKDRFSHYASKEDIIRAATQGVAITAVCGKKWKPSRSPEKYTICPTCQEIYEGMNPGDDD